MLDNLQILTSHGVFNLKLVGCYKTYKSWLHRVYESPEIIDKMYWVYE